MPVDTHAPYAKDDGKGPIAEAAVGGSLVTLWEALMALTACAGLSLVRWGEKPQPGNPPPLPRAT